MGKKTKNNIFKKGADYLPITVWTFIHLFQEVSCKEGLLCNIDCHIAVGFVWPLTSHALESSLLFVLHMKQAPNDILKMFGCCLFYLYQCCTFEFLFPFFVYC